MITALTFFQTGVVSRLLSVLESVISKLARYDEGSILGSILSFTVISFLFAGLLFILFLQLRALDAALYLLCNFLLAPLGKLWLASGLSAHFSTYSISFPFTTTTTTTAAIKHLQQA